MPLRIIAIKLTQSEQSTASFIATAGISLELSLSTVYSLHASVVMSSTYPALSNTSSNPAASTGTTTQWGAPEFVHAPAPAPAAAATGPALAAAAAAGPAAAASAAAAAAAPAASPDSRPGRAMPDGGGRAQINVHRTANTCGAVDQRVDTCLAPINTC
jgi:hypothetical protein